MSSHCETIVQAISSFYNVLSTFGYLPPSSIATPPPSGWHADDDAEPPSPVRALLRREGKDEAVLDVLNHLPYLTNADLQVHHDTIALDWRPVHHLTTPSSGASATQLSVHHALALPQTLPQACLEPTGLQPAVPAHMVALTRATSNYGRWLLLDVEAGTVTNYSLLGEPQGEDEEEEGVAAGSGTGWRRHETARVADFFAAWGAKLTSLAWVPVPGDVESRTGEIRTPACVGDEVQEEYAAIYREHGWGTSDFRLDECKKAIVQCHRRILDAQMAAFRRAKDSRRDERREAAAAAAAGPSTRNFNFGFTS